MTTLDDLFICTATAGATIIAKEPSGLKISVTATSEPPAGTFAVDVERGRSFFRTPPRTYARRHVRGLVAERYAADGAARITGSWPLFFVQPLPRAGERIPVFTVRRAVALHLKEDETEIEGQRRYQPTRTPCRVYSVGNDYLTATPGPRAPRGNNDWHWVPVLDTDIPRVFGWRIWRHEEEA